MILSSLIISCRVSNVAAKYSASATPGATVPRLPMVWLNAEPPGSCLMPLMSIQKSEADSSFLITGPVMRLISSTPAAAVMMTVPGLYTVPSGYFWVIERLSLPVGIFIPSATAKLLAACTAS